MDLSKVICHSLVFGNRNIHAKFLNSSSVSKSLHFFGLHKPNVDGHTVLQDEIAVYLLGLEFKSEESLDVVIQWLGYLKQLFQEDVKSVCYSQENQEVDYGE